MMLQRSIFWFCVTLLLLTGCGKCGSEDDGPTAAGVVEVLSDGEGEENAESLYPIRAGSIFPYRKAVVRAPIEFAAGRVGYRYMAHRGLGISTGPIDGKTESWLTTDDEGVWFHGSTDGGVLDSPILIVPESVKVGKRWRSGDEDTTLEYEVLARDEADNELGTTVLWDDSAELRPAGLPAVRGGVGATFGRSRRASSFELGRVRADAGCLGRARVPPRRPGPHSS